MKQLGQLTKLIMTIFLISCSNKVENINGHWHSSKPELENYKTLDIDDSLAMMDKYEIKVSKYSWVYRTDRKTGKSILPFQEYQFTDNYRLVDDTLEIGDSQFTFQYFKSNINDCQLRDRYARSVINISLSESLNSENYDLLGYCTNMFIGKVKRQYNEDFSSKYFEELTAKYPDSTFIQVEDILITLSDIPQFCDREKDSFPQNEPIELVLHVDRGVDDLFFRRVLEKINSPFIVYKAVNKTGQLGVVKINED